MGSFICVFVLGLLNALLLGGFFPLNNTVAGVLEWIVLAAFIGFLLRLHRPIARRPLHAFWLGFGFALGYFCLSLYWLYISIHYFGGVNPVFSSLAVVIFCCYLSLFYAVPAALHAWVFRKAPPILRLISFGAVFVILGSLPRATLLTGFPWSNIAYGQTETWLANWGPLGSIYLIDAILIWLAGCLYLAARSQTRLQLLRYGTGSVLILLISALLGLFQWSQPLGSPVYVRLVQPNTAQESKFNPNTQYHAMVTALSLGVNGLPLAKNSPQVIIYPETTISFFPNSFNMEQLDSLAALAQQTQAHIYVGIPLIEQGGFTNSAIDLAPGITGKDIANLNLPFYNKQHLVPFGEYIPKGFAWLLRDFNIPLGNFNTPTNHDQVFVLDGRSWAPNICYEDIFPRDIRRQVAAPINAHVLFNISNLAWFGDSIALYQHLQMSRMRAIETARPMLSVGNTGMTANIAPNGHIVAQLPPQQAGVLDTVVQPTTGYTPYVRMGNNSVFLLFCILTTICVIAQLGMNKKQRSISRNS